MNEKQLLQDGDVHKDQELNELIFNPYNSKNREITKNQVEKILHKYGVYEKIHNINLYKRAFIHRSYVKRPELENKERGVVIVDKPYDCMSLKTKSNERLEFLGDGVLECITKYYLYRRFPKENEGFMTEKKIALVKNETIGRLAYEMGLNNWYIISKNAEEKKIRTNHKKLGCLFEAFLGALFLDCNKIDMSDDDEWKTQTFITGPGFQFAQIFVENIYEQHIDWMKLIQHDDNYKNILQVKVQKEFKTTPVYLENSHDLEEGYTTGVYICLGQEHYSLTHDNSIPYENFGSFKAIQEYVEENEKVFVFLASSKHKIKKKAEQVCCRLAIEKINAST